MSKLADVFCLRIYKEKLLVPNADISILGCYTLEDIGSLFDSGSNGCALNISNKNHANTQTLVNVVMAHFGARLVSNSMLLSAS